jgi:hypothetical protein
LVELITNSSLRRRGFFDYDFINWMADEHRRGHKDWSANLWCLLNLSVWYDAGLSSASHRTPKTRMSDDAVTLTPQPADEAMPEVFGSLASGVAVTFTTRLVILCCVIGSSVIVAHWLGPEGTGALAVLNCDVGAGVAVGQRGHSFGDDLFRGERAPVGRGNWSNSLLFSLGGGA